MNREKINVRLVLAMFVLFQVLCGGMAVAESPQRYAVIIGVNDYADARIGDLKFAESDAKAVCATLTDPAVGKFPKENVTLLLGPAATPSAIKAALYKLRGVDKDDLVVIFYSGHGAKEGDEAFWVTQNADVKALPATALSNTDIRKYLAMIPSQKLVTLLDCCYAASTVKKNLTDPTKLFGDFAGKGRVTIAGSADSQEALEMPDAQAGVFTHYLVKGLRGQADANEDGVVTFEELWTYLGQNVRKASVRQGGLHEPVIITESGVTPEFLLTFNPTAKAVNDKSLATLRNLFDAGKITGAQYDAGRSALTNPAVDALATARREVYSDLTAGRLSPQYLQAALRDAESKARKSSALRPSASSKPTLAVVPFDVLGDVPVKDAGKILAEQLLPLFGRRYELVDLNQLRHFVETDDLTIEGVMELAHQPQTKSLRKAVKLRAVQYLVVGTIAGSPDGSLSVTARISDWQTGSVGRVAQVRAENFATLRERMALLAGRLLGNLADVGPGPAEPSTADLPADLTDLHARIQQFQSLYEEYKTAKKTMTKEHPRIAFLQKKLDEFHDPLRKDIEAKRKSLLAADAELAHLYKPTHAKRQALTQEIKQLETAAVDLPIPQALYWLEKVLPFLRKVQIEQYYLLEIVQAQVKAGEKAGARKTIQLSLAMAQQMEGHINKSGELLSIAETQSKIGDKVGARKTIQLTLARAQQMEGQINKFHALLSIAPIQMKIGDMNGARSTIQLALIEAQRNVYPSLRINALSKIAQIQAKIGDKTSARDTIQLALATVEEIKIDTDDKAKALSEIALAHAKMGDKTGARDTIQHAFVAIEEIKDDAGDKATALLTISKAQMKVGDKAGARNSSQLAFTSAKEIKNSGLRDSHLFLIGYTQAKGGDITGALTTIQRIEDPISKNSILNSIAQAQVEAGDIAGALSTVRRIENSTLKNGILYSIAQAQVKAGNITGALSTVRRIEDSTLKISILYSIAQAQVKAGDKAGARNTIQLTLTSAKGNEDASNRASTLLCIAYIQFEVGDEDDAKKSFQRAIATAQRIADIPTKAITLSCIARLQVKAGQYEEMAAWLEAPAFRNSLGDGIWHVYLGAAEGFIEQYKPSPEKPD